MALSAEEQKAIRELDLAITKCTGDLARAKGILRANLLTHVAAESDVAVDKQIDKAKQMAKAAVTTLDALL